MKKNRLIIISLFLMVWAVVGGAVTAYAQDTSQFYRGQVVEIIQDMPASADGITGSFQKLRVKLLEGAEKGKQIIIDYGGSDSIQEDQKVKKGETIVVTQAQVEGKSVYSVNDIYRLGTLVWIALAFLICAVIFGRVKGFTSVLGMLFGLLILVKLIIPEILAGQNPLMMSLIGVVLIGLVSIYLAHGFNRRTSIALASTLITMGIAAVLSIIFVSMSRLSGAGQEETWQLQLQGFAHIDLRGLLLGGILIGVLGVLEDVTTAQVAVVDELRKASPTLKVSELYARGLSVGQEHIAALINTLVLAYAGASFPLLILFAIDKTTPWWVNLNSEFVAEEILRTLIGSLALVLAVPIATFFAAYFLTKKSTKRTSAYQRKT